MELLAITKKVSKTKWQGIVKIIKDGGLVELYPVKTVAKDGTLQGFYYAIVGYRAGEASSDSQTAYQVMGLVRRKLKVDYVDVVGSAIVVTEEVYLRALKVTSSKSVVKVTEIIYAEWAKRTEEYLMRYVLETEEGVLGIIGDMVKKVSSKLARDTFEVTYSSYIQGEMRVTNKGLQKSKPLDVAYAYTSCIGVEVNPRNVIFAIMHGDDTERGIYGGDTYIQKSVSLDRLPIIQFKQGKYFGEAYKVMLDIAVRSMLIASEEGYKEYVKKHGYPNSGEAVKYSWLTLKDGTKVTWDNYKVEDFMQYLK